MQLRISPHHVFESRKKAMVSAHTVEAHLLKGISPPDFHMEPPRGSLILANMQRHATLFSLNECYCR